MRITPGTDIPRETLAGLSVFEGLSDAQLDWIREHSERMEVPADGVITRPDDLAEYMYVLLSGTFQWKFGVGGQNAVFHEEVPGTVGGILPFSRATHAGNGSSTSLSPPHGVARHGVPDPSASIAGSGMRSISEQIRWSMLVPPEWMSSPPKI